MGALETGNHTQKEFLDIMKKQFEKACPIYIKSLTCKSCIKLTKEVTNDVKKQIKYKKLNKTYKISKKKDDLIRNLRLRCSKCKKRPTRKCKLTDYIEFSGAEDGKC